MYGLMMAAIKRKNHAKGSEIVTIFLREKRSLVNTMLLFAILLYGSSHFFGLADAREGGIPFVSSSNPLFVVTQLEGSIYSLNSLPQGIALNPGEETEAAIGYDVKDPDIVDPKPRKDDDHQTSVVTSSGSGGGGMIENQHLFYDETSFRLPAFTDFSADAEFGDVDGDGDLDLLVANTDGQRNRLFMNNGHGIFSDASDDRLPENSDFSLAVECGDIVGDGDLDIFVANNFAFQLPNCTLLSGQNRLLLNDGEGVFTDETNFRLPLSIAASTDAKFVDADGDEDLDIIVTNSIRPGDCLFLGGGQLQILVNDGRGFFSDETDSRLPSEFHSDVSVSLGDIDGDGDVDLVVANPFNQDRVLVNDGSGIFTDQSKERLPTLFTSTREVVLFDVDNDGDLDLFCANDSSSVWAGQDGAQNRIFINNGVGEFTDNTETRLPSVKDVSMGGADVGDVDGDGDLDVIVANNKLMSEGRQNHILINDGTGFFGDEVFCFLPTVSDVSADIIFGDVNGDNVLDAFVANYGEQNLLLIGGNDPKGEPVEPEIFMGDINIDGEVNVMDVLAIVNHILENVSLTGEGFDRANCNGDGYVDILDALGIVNLILGMGECNPGSCRAQVTPEAMEFIGSLEPYLTDADFASFLVLLHGESFVPGEYGLSQNYPNPFNSETRVDFQIPVEGRVTLTIFNALGQQIRIVTDGQHEADFHTQMWDGRDDSGDRVASGVYYYQLKSGDFIQTKKMLLMK